MPRDDNYRRCPRIRNRNYGPDRSLRLPELTIQYDRLRNNIQERPDPLIGCSRESTDRLPVIDQ